MNWQNKKLIVVVGPTAVGKTAVAIDLAKYLKTEIISADSRQIFRELTIGTAKPNKTELAAVPHHFIDSHSIEEHYDAAQYGEDALALIHKLFEHHDELILCGGSGLYVKAVLQGFDEIPEIPEDVRSDLIRQYEQHGIDWLQEKMHLLDPGHYAEIDKFNPHRLIRALEVKIGTGMSIQSFRTDKRLKHPFAIIKIGLELPREVLYDRIDKRMDKMIDEGLFNEAESLIKFKNHNALQTVGYQEIFDFMDGMYDKEEAIRLLKRNSRRYAKRQLTWFKRDEETRWFHPIDLSRMIEFINNSKLKTPD